MADTPEHRGGAGRSAADFALAAVIALPLIYILPFPKSINDYGVYVAVGRRMIETHSLADTVFLAHTVAGEPYTNATWGAALIFAAWDRLGGPWLTVLLHGLCAAMAFWVPYAHARWGRGAGSGRAALATLLMAPLLLGNLGLRPQTLILWIFPLLHWIGSTYADRRWAPAAVAALSIIWTNVHGAFPLVIPLMGTFFVEALARRDRAGALDTGVLLAVAALATVVSPYGWGTYGYVADNMGISSVIGSQEFEPVSATSWRSLRLLLAAGVSLALLARRPWTRPADLFAAVGLGGLAFTGQRYAIWWGMALIPILAERLAVLPRARDIRLSLSPLSARVMTGVFVALAAASVLRFGRDDVADYFQDPTPFRAAERLRQRAPEGARLFNSAEWGALFPWIPGPQWPIYIDTRAWIYPEALWEEYVRIARAEPGWEAVLRDRQIDAVAVDMPRFERLAAALEASPGWEALMTEPAGVVYARRDP